MRARLRAASREKCVRPTDRSTASRRGRRASTRGANFRAKTRESRIPRVFYARNRDVGSIGQSDKPTDGFSRANLEAREKRDTLFRAVVILRVKNDRASTRRGFRERIARERSRARR
jgi:hypothetical protein